MSPIGGPTLLFMRLSFSDLNQIGIKVQGNRKVFQSEPPNMKSKLGRKKRNVVFRCDIILSRNQQMQCHKIVA